MAYTSKRELPATIRDVLPEAAQDVYIEVYNQVWHEHKEKGESTAACSTVAHQLAWDAVNREFIQVEDGDGQKRWYRRGEEPSEEAQTDEQEGGILEKLKSLF